MAIVESDWLIRLRLEFESVKFGALQARQVDSPSLPRCARELVLAVSLFYQQFESTCSKSNSLYFADIMLRF